MTPYVAENKVEIQQNIAEFLDDSLTDVAHTVPLTEDQWVEEVDDFQRQAPEDEMIDGEYLSTDFIREAVRAWMDGAQTR